MGRKLDTFERHELRIARDTLRMPAAMQGVMGGPSVGDAIETIERLTGKSPTQRNLTSEEIPASREEEL